MLWTDSLASQFDRHARERGQDYEALGRVSLLRAGADGAEATVRGTRPYRVYVTRGRRGVTLSCTCPRFETTPCKHVWATLVALDRGESRPAMGAGPPLPSLSPGRVVPLWQARLDGLSPSRPIVGSPTGPPWPAGREVVYEIDLPATLEAGGLVVSLFHRRRRKDGGWSRPQPFRVVRQRGRRAARPVRS